MGAPARAIGNASEHVATTLSQMIPEKDDMLSQAMGSVVTGRYAGESAHFGQAEPTPANPVTLINFMRKIFGFPIVPHHRDRSVLSHVDGRSLSPS